MSPLYLNLKKATMQARKHGNKNELSIGLVVIGDVETEMKRTGRDITDEEFIVRARKLIGANEETISFTKDSDRIAQLNAEIEHLRVFLPELPKQLTDAELETVIRDSGLDHIGKIMPFLNKEYRGQFDGKSANAIARKVLSE